MPAGQPLSPRIRNRLKSGIGRPFARFAERIGFDTAPRDFYSPIPDLDRIPESAWDEPTRLGGIELDLDRQMAFLERDLGPFLAEFSPSRAGSRKTTDFLLDNGSYESVDAETLYAMIRFQRPRRIIELGSGRSTQVVSIARRRNAEDGADSRHRVIDPYPSETTQTAAAGQYRLDAVSATDVPVSDFSILESNDILFVDTTHTVKFGSDVNHIVLEILPTLKPGVVIHFHDIFLPWPYPRRWLERSRRFWAEQYLLQAFLAFNEDFEPILSANALSRAEPDRIASAIPSFGAGVSPGAFWIRRSR